MDNEITQKTVLNTGLKILTGHVPDEATKYYYINVEVGSGFSDDTIDGEAHFLEHMLFNGVSTDKGDIDFKTLRQTREKKGVIFGAYTTDVSTRYFARIPTVLGKQGLNEAAYELSRMVVTPTLPEERIEHEKKVIRNEWGHRQGNLEIYLYEQSQKLIYSSNPAFGHRGLGEKETISEITKEDLINFMAAHYTQPNTTIAIAGPVDHGEIVQEISSIFQDMPLNNKPDNVVETPIEKAYEVSEIQFVPHNFFQISIPWIGMNTIESDAISDISEFILISRLNEIIRETQGNVYGLGIGATRNRDLGRVVIYTSTEPETVNSVIEAIGYELNRLVNGDVSDDLETAQNILMEAKKSAYVDSDILAGNLSYFERYGYLFDVEGARKMFSEVTTDDVQELYKQSLSGNKALVGMGPEGSFMPQAEFDAIMTLHEQPSKGSLKPRFDKT